MKLYEMAKAPNPRRVRMFLAEKGLLDHVKRVEIDLKEGENLTPEFVAKNPMKTVPVLELNDGTCISESMAICRYMEQQFPNTQNLLGKTSRESALIEQWQRWLEFQFFLPTGMAFQHLTGYFEDRMTTNEAWGNDCKLKVERFYDFLDEQLQGETWICVNRFTVADITAFCTIQFARVIDVRILPEHKNLQAWYKRMESRDSAKV